MKNILKDFKLVLFTVLILMAGSCTDDFEEMNTDPNSPVDVPAINIFTHALESHISYEMGGWIQHTYLGTWSQQWTKVQYIDEDKYMPRNMDGDFHDRYTNALQDLAIILDKTNPANEDGGNPELYAAAKIWKVLIFDFLTDLWGDVPYTEANMGLTSDNVTPVYDTQASIYDGMIAELDEANSLLSSTSFNFGSGDILFGGDPMMWKKFGNSLRLRILNRAAGTPWDFTYDMVGGTQVTTTAGAAAMSDADSKIAAVLSNPSQYPIMTSNDDNAMLAYPGLPYRNPIFNTLFSRTDQGVSQTMIDYLNARTDPRVHIYAQPVPKTIGTETLEYNGHQNGLSHAAATFQNISILGTAIAYTETAPLYVLCADEVELIQAEYYMRAGDDAAAQAHYEAGIAASMDRWGCTDGATITPSNRDGDDLSAYSVTVDQAAYLADPLVAWGGSTAEKFQKIIEQKWAAMFGQGVQAWIEVRRTGFPARIFEYELEGAYYPNMGMPTRLTYSTVEDTYNGANLDAAKERQGVQDLNEGLFGSWVWWNTRRNPIPTEIDPPAADKQ
ncbi:SusD/RagB family nutrient-binding outer membrane lipoprotein [uncultured Draconibacterium sp.]|uniref:SusD/RagB family nutrient-binding outer membrane lipoprotein n=1 Tax=uncultured Draconibacterium sp. TaxID=1573823 RepID=UPI0029C61DF6|nr:SusD/RagB family nutrient-binding outer membrane lipoprotein [uncultured Draconibacterium sp.]